MKKSLKKIKAFTMAEIMITMMIIGIVSLATYGVTRAQTSYATKYQYYSTFINLQKAIGQLLADGYTLSGSTTIYKSLPTNGNRTSANVTNPDGLCHRLTEIMNTVGPISYTKTATDATIFTIVGNNQNFTTTNGTRYFGFGQLVANGATPYNVYVDIDGSKGSSVLNTDVMKFIINTDGSIFPDPASKGATDTKYLSASVRYRDNTGNLVIIERGVSYYQAVCDANPPGANPILYNTTTCSRSAAAANCATNTCEVIINKPGF